MGQKVNPNGYRLSLRKNWESVWYMPKSEYGLTILSDEKIRTYVHKALKAAGVAKVEIKRYMNKVEIELAVARPGVVIGRGGTQIEDVKKAINKIAKSKVVLKVIEVKDPEISARLIADRIVTQLERRVVPKFIMSSEMEKAVGSGKIQGIRIVVGGRIKGALIARTEKVQWGVIPLQTLKADIDYAFCEAQVPNAGKQGIKVWVLKKTDNK